MSNQVQNVGGSSVSKTRKLVGMAIFTALVVVLQVISYYVKVGPFSVTFVLIPVVVGAALYGAGSGAFLGGVFAVVVIIGCISGVDAGGFILWSANPLYVILICLAKGILAGWLAGIVYKAIAKQGKHLYLGVLAAAIVSPVVNTGIFLLGMTLLFHETLVAWAGGISLVYFAFIGLAGINFLVELGSNVVLSTVAVRIIKASKTV